MSSIPTFTPREIVSELDRYIIGQREAKRAVAIALRNRWRRQQVSGELRDEISPKNIIMMMVSTSGLPQKPSSFKRCCCLMMLLLFRGG